MNRHKAIKLSFIGVCIAIMFSFIYVTWIVDVLRTTFISNVVNVVQSQRVQEDEVQPYAIDSLAKQINLALNKSDTFTFKIEYDDGTTRSLDSIVRRKVTH